MIKSAVKNAVHQIKHKKTAAMSASLAKAKKAVANKLAKDAAKKKKSKKPAAKIHVSKPVGGIK